MSLSPAVAGRGCDSFPETPQAKVRPALTDESNCPPGAQKHDTIAQPTMHSGRKKTTIYYDYM